MNRIKHLSMNKLNMTKEETRKGNVAMLFRTLVRFYVFPVKADFEKKTLKLNFCSKEILIYMIYLSLLFFASFGSNFIIGYSRVWDYFTGMMRRSTATELISIFGAFINIFVFQGYFITFLKKLGMQHQWNREGTNSSDSSLSESFNVCQ